MKIFSICALVATHALESSRKNQFIQNKEGRITQQLLAVNCILRNYSIEVSIYYRSTRKIKLKLMSVKFSVNLRNDLLAWKHKTDI